MAEFFNGNKISTGNTFHQSISNVGKLGFYPSEYDRSETAEELNFRINKYYAKKMVQANNK